MMALTEIELKQSFAVKVEAPLALINYRALEESCRGIEKLIDTETFTHKRELLFKIRRDLKKILNEL